MVYHNLDENQLILRDYLALDRTILANERTLLAYIRTSIALLATGGVIIRIFPDNIFLRITGGLLILAAICTLVLGIIRFRILSGKLDCLNAHGPSCAAGNKE